MDELCSSTAFSFSKKEIVRNGINGVMEPAINSLIDCIEEKFIDLAASELKDFENNYQMTLTIKKIEEK